MTTTIAANNDSDSDNVNVSEAPEPKKHDLPFSPAARAFFAALDQQNDQLEEEGQSDETKTSSSSLFIQKRIQSLGWRNRYSQTEQYPIQIQASHDSTSCSVSKFTVRQFQRGEEEGTYGTGATVWPASMVLVKYLERLSFDDNNNDSNNNNSNNSNSSIIKGRRVFELGAGTGVASIAAAALGASYCLCTDGEPPVVQLARDNVAAAALELNETQKESKPASTNNDDADNTTITTIRNCPVAVQKYWWGTDTDQLLRQHGPCDVILVSDCVLPKLYPIAPLVQALDELLPPLSSGESTIARDDGRSSTPVAILSYEHRHYPDYHPKEHFVASCDARNLLVETVPVDQHDPVYSVDDIEIWRVRRRRPKGASHTCTISSHNSKK